MSPSLAPTPLAGGRFVIVDDQRDLADNLCELLEDCGATVRYATTAAEGLGLASSGFDVALVDVRLPDATGLSMVPRLRALDHTCAIVLITGHASIDDAIEAVRAGAFAYLLKPFDSQDMLNTVARAFEAVTLARRTTTLALALERSEASLRTLVDTVEALLLVLDADGRVVQTNPAVAAATGVDLDRLTGLDWAEHFVPEGERAAIRRAYRDVNAGNVGVSFEGRVLHRDDHGLSERIIRWRFAGLTTGDGFRVYASGHDMTEVRALERRTRLAEKLAAVGTVSAGLAHEIRNPLNAASLQLQLLERRLGKLPYDNKLQEPIGLVREELDRLSRLVTEFLQFARPTALHARDVDITEVVQHVVELQRPEAQARAVSLTLTHPPGGTVTIEADAERIKQILLNLVRNAIEAAPEKGHVWVTVVPDGAGVRICVKDDGPGIAAEHRHRIFEPFFTTKETGTGLGMAIVHSLVALHGGHVEVHCDAGTEMVITLPRRVPSPGFAPPSPFITLRP